VQAAYRFMEHEDVQFEAILQPHYAATEARISELGEGTVVLVAQDTGSLNYSHLEIEGIGPIGSTPDGAQGLYLHSSLSLTEQGVPLGFLDAKCWGIEVFHRVLKSGCKAEARQLGHGERLQTCLAIDMVVAWRIHYMTLLRREVPDMPCDVVFGEAEWKALLAHSTKNPIAPEQPPALQTAVYLLGKVGGFLGRKCDGQPGAETLWRGLMMLSIMADVWRVMVSP
jgi:hypothetical protein